MPTLQRERFRPAFRFNGRNGSPPAGPPAGVCCGTPPKELLGHVGFLLARCAGYLRDTLSDALAPLGITAKHYGVLTLLVSAGPLSQQRIGEGTWHDRTTMVNLVDDLEELGLVRRESLADDRRAYAVCLTPKGRRAQARARQIVIRVNRQFLAPLCAGERRQLHALLKRLVLQRCQPNKSARGEIVRREHA